MTCKNLPSFPRRRESIIFLFFLSFFSFSVEAVEVKGVRIWPSPESTRVVFDLNHPVTYHLISKENNKKIEILLHHTHTNFDFSKLSLRESRIKKIYTVTQDKTATLVILDLHRPLKPNSFTLSPNQQYGNRLVLDLDLMDADLEQSESKPVLNEKEEILALFAADRPNQETKEIKEPLTITNQEDKEVVSKNHSNEKEKSKLKEPTSLKTVTKTVASKNDFIVAIDAGHGGEDPGAIGPCGTREKDIVLAIARHLKQLIDKEPGMKSVLIRSGDYYIGLQDRVARARKHKADLFVSIHADAFPDKRAEGASVFTVSERAASSTAAKWLADRENRSDLVGGVSLANKNKVLASVLLDLSQTASKEEGLHAAKHVLKSLTKVGRLHSGKVEQAGFAVLKAPDVPSMLVETGFISHPNSERKLKTIQHQKKLAAAIMAGIKEYHAKRIKIAMQ